MSQPAAPRPFRFGVQAKKATSGAAWTALARHVEDLGYSVLTMPDHFDDQLAPVPALAAAAAATTDLRIGALVWDNDYRHPVVLAKEVATMDVLSEGRVELGLGAGWTRTDYEQSGIAFDPPGERVDRLVEGLAVVKGLFAPGPFSFAGTHYTVDGLDGLPKPVQQPGPPVLIGGGGKRVLAFAAREADIVGINGTLTAGAIGPEALATMTEAAIDEKVAIVRAAAGTRMAAIELHVRAFMVNVTDDRPGAIGFLAELLGVEASMIEHSPFALIGSPAQIADDLLARRERWGFSYVTVSASDVDSFAPVVAQLAST